MGTDMASGHDESHNLIRWADGLPVMEEFGLGIGLVLAATIIYVVFSELGSDDDESIGCLGWILVCILGFSGIDMLLHVV